MEIVINIPDEYHRNLLRNCRFSSEEIPVVSLAIATGTILPKGHGDLIDRSKLEMHYVGTDIGTDCPVYLLPTVDEAPAIVKADKENN